MRRIGFHEGAASGMQASVNPFCEEQPRPHATPVLEEEAATDVLRDVPWNVVVWDDPVNLMGYVVYVFQRLFGWPKEKATQHMLEVHKQGRSIVATEERERAEFYVTRLHLFGLQATMERATS